MSGNAKKCQGQLCDRAWQSDERGGVSLFAIMESWNDIRRWRKEQRSRLTEERRLIPLRSRGPMTAAIIAALEECGLEARGGCIGFYWPLPGEPDLRPFVRSLLERGLDAALPVVVEKNAPLEFWRWHAGTRLTRQSVWGIPVPAERAVVEPQVLLIPLIGFDAACHRLGNGGGYYDRTLAARQPRPFSIGVGLELGSLPTIYPQPHDIPMDLIVTNKRVMSRSAVP